MERKNEASKHQVLKSSLTRKHKRNKVAYIKERDGFKYDVTKKDPHVNVMVSSIREHKKQSFSFKDRLAGAKFRQLNEVLYSSNSRDAQSYFNDNESDFISYHDGWQRQQLKGWIQKPVDMIAERIKVLHKSNDIIADMGCGEGRLFELLSNLPLKINSFDLVATKPFITKCDVSRTPLESSVVSFVVFSLSLMNVNYGDSLVEASRILKLNGRLLIAEVESRFDQCIEENFIDAILGLGFKVISTRRISKMFIMFEFALKKKSQIVPTWPSLRPCIYKRR